MLYALCAGGVLTYEYEKEQGEGYQRRASIAAERQRDAYDGQQAQHHAYVDKEVEEKYRGHRVAVYA